VKSLLWFGELGGQQYALDAEFRLWSLNPSLAACFRGEERIELRVALQGDGEKTVAQCVTELLKQRASLYETTFKVLSSESLYPHEVKGLEYAIERCIKNQLIPAVVQVQSPTGGSQSDA